MADAPTPDGTVNVVPRVIAYLQKQQTLEATILAGDLLDWVTELQFAMEEAKLVMKKENPDG